MTQYGTPAHRGPVSRRELRASGVLPTRRDGDAVPPVGVDPRSGVAEGAGEVRRSAGAGSWPRTEGQQSAAGPGTAAMAGCELGRPETGYQPGVGGAGGYGVDAAGGQWGAEPGSFVGAAEPGPYGSEDAAGQSCARTDPGRSAGAGGSAGGEGSLHGFPMTAATSLGASYDGGTHQGRSAVAGGSAAALVATQPGDGTEVRLADGVTRSVPSPDFRAPDAALGGVATEAVVSRSTLRAERAGGVGGRRRGHVVASLLGALVLVGGACAMMLGADFGGVRQPQFVAGPVNGAQLSTKQTQFTVSSDSEGLHCQLNSGNWYVCGETVELAGLYDGQHVLKVRAVSGDQVSGAVSRTFSVVAQTDPVEFTTGPPSGATVWSLPVVYGINQVSGESVPECRVNDRPWRACQTAFVVSGLEPGQHTVQVRLGGGAVDERSFEFSGVAPGAEAAPEGGLDGESGDGEVEASGPQVPVPVATPAPQGTHGWSRPTPTRGGGGEAEQGAVPDRTVAPVIPEAGPKEPAAPVSGYGVRDVSALRVHEGDLTITEPGAHVQGLDVRGFVRIKAPNVRFSHSIVRGGATTRSTALVQSEQPGVVLENLTLSPTTPSVYIDGVKGYGFTARALEINNVVDSVLIFGSHTTVEGSWLHSHRHFASDPHQGGNPSHDDGIQVEGGDHITLRNNVVEGMHNAAIMVTQNRALTRHLLIEGNSLSGGGCTVNIAEKGKGPLVNLQIANNIFGSSRISKCPIITPKSTAIQAEGNSYSSSGEPANIRYGD